MRHADCNCEQAAEGPDGAIAECHRGVCSSMVIAKKDVNVVLPLVGEHLSALLRHYGRVDMDVHCC